MERLLLFALDSFDAFDVPMSEGVYFARDAAYSSYKTYAIPDNKGYQYVMACRVVVGEYCPGKDGAIAPDVRDAKTQSLYDSTVGLLSNDTMDNPSIYVTYHDAQAYPEVRRTSCLKHNVSFIACLSSIPISPNHLIVLNST